MFKRIHDTPHPVVTINIDGKDVTVPAGESVAAALLALGTLPFRTTPVSGAPRAPCCMMGICFECLMEVDGVANQQTCLIRVRDGMRLRRQTGAGPRKP